MAVYPFYVESNAEGRRSPIAGGCRNKDGSQDTTIYQRERGEIVELFKIHQTSYINSKGERVLTCEITDRYGTSVASDETIY